MINIIVAIARKGAIGHGGDLLFPISADLKRFKAITMGHPIIMGRKTFESFPKGPLPGRRNIVVTRNADYSREGIETAGSLEEAVALARQTDDEVFIIGGGTIYEQGFGMAGRLYLTEIDAEAPDADTFFPAIKADEWQTVDAGDYEQDPRSGVRYRFMTLERLG